MHSRVLVLADHFGYANGVIHGVTTYYLNVLPRLRERGVEVRCCFLRPEHPLAGQLRECGVEVEFLAARKWDPLVARRIEQIVRGMGAQVLHVAGMKSALLGRWVARRTGAAVIIHSHDMNMPPAPIRWLYRLARLKQERGFAISDAVAARMGVAYGMEPRHVTVLHNGVDVEALAGARIRPRPTGLPVGGRIILWVGRLHSIKGPQRMIRIMARLVKSVPDCHLLVAGDGPERQACESLVHELRLGDRVHMLGQRADIVDLLGHSLLLCVTSVNEGFSLAAMEAAAAGVPVVAYAVGGLREVVSDGSTGLLVRDGDEKAFVDNVAALLSDEVRRTAMSADSRARARGFSLDAHVTSLVREYAAASRGSA